MDLLNFIVWDVDPGIFEFFGREVRYYGLFFALAFLVSQFIMNHIYKLENQSEKAVDSLTMYLIVGTVVGARLGHCFFYDPFDYTDANGVFHEGYLSHPIEILKIWEGGLASHGGGVGILIALFLYARKFKFEYLWILDRVAIVVAISAFLIRMGNLMNSEIVGLVTDVPWAFKFVRNDCPPPNICDLAAIPARHPSQLYEAISSLLLFGLLFYLYKKTNIGEMRGKLFGLLLSIMFTLRFFYEFLKENQSAFEDGLALNMGQNLSIPFVLVGLYLLIRKKK